MPVIQKKKEKKPNVAKMYLLQLRYINDQIDQERQEMERLTSMLRDIQGINYDRVQVQTSPHDKLGDAFAEIMEHRDQMLQYILELSRLREKIRQQIAGMPAPMHRQILFRYYLGQQRFEKIAADLGYSYQSVINAHGRALQTFEKMYLKSSE